MMLSNCSAELLWQPVGKDELGRNELWSGLIDHNQKMTVAAMTMAEKKVWAQRS